MYYLLTVLGIILFAAVLVMMVLRDNNDPTFKK